MTEYYLPSHEWARQEPTGGLVTIGLSAFAAGEVGEVIHIELPKLGAILTKGKPCAEIESVKSVNDFYAPVDGVVTEINPELAAHPELLNQDSTGKGWFVRLTPTSATPLAGLLSSEQYRAQIGKGGT